MTLAAKGLWAFLAVASYATAVRAQTVQIIVVNGKTGRPVAGACVGVRMMKDARNGVFVPTDKNGVARMRLTQNGNEVEVAYDSKLGCGGNGANNPVLKYDDTLTTYTTGNNPSCAFPQSMPKARWKEIDFPTKEVLQHGVISANICGQATATPHPGEVTLFVRSRNFREKAQDWRNSEAFPF